MSPHTIYQCPWCGATAPPVPTDEAVAVAHYGDPHDPKWRAVNNSMCPECHGCGGVEDFRLASIGDDEVPT